MRSFKDRSLAPSLTALRAFAREAGLGGGRGSVDVGGAPGGGIKSLAVEFPRDLWPRTSWITSLGFDTDPVSGFGGVVA